MEASVFYGVFGDGAAAVCGWVPGDGELFFGGGYEGDDGSVGVGGFVGVEGFGVGGGGGVGSPVVAVVGAYGDGVVCVVGDAVVSVGFVYARERCEGFGGFEGLGFVGVVFGFDVVAVFGDVDDAGGAAGVGGWLPGGDDDGVACGGGQ